MTQDAVTMHCGSCYILHAHLSDPSDIEIFCDDQITTASPGEMNSNIWRMSSVIEWSTDLMHRCTLACSKPRIEEMQEQ